ncbi:MAG: hypothetical protein Q8Q08_03355 [Candidatus Omnitrophota bacterium]|nr:hypothetical protein [Candidatus Omnitrophota bacterium]MDZ4243242.1 hypothetical protein [Candidatus Omnitrophota bacterium]
MIEILKIVPLAAFWAAVLAFVPVTYYLLVKNPPLLEAEYRRQQKIFIIGEDADLRRKRRSRLKMVGLIYAVCLSALLAAAVANFLRSGAADIQPFDILSTFSAAVFGFSLVTYLPVALYLLWRDPWRNRREGISLGAVYWGYGGLILVFSVRFIYIWARHREIFLGMSDVLSSLSMVLIGAAAVAYIPILTYILLSVSPSARSRPLRTSTVFVIYSMGAILFAVIFSFQWLKNRAYEQERIPLGRYFRL